MRTVDFYQAYLILSEVGVHDWSQLHLISCYFLLFIDISYHHNWCHEERTNASTKFVCNWLNHSLTSYSFMSFVHNCIFTLGCWYILQNSLHFTVMSRVELKVIPSAGIQGTLQNPILWLSKMGMLHWQTSTCFILILMFFFFSSSL